MPGRSVRINARVCVGEPAREELVVLQGDDPPLPEPATKVSRYSCGWFCAVSQACQDDVREPIGEGLGAPDSREPCSRVGHEALVIVLRAELLDQPVGKLDGVLGGQIHAFAARRGDEVGGIACQQQAALLHRLDHADPQIKAADVVQRQIVQLPADTKTDRELVANPLGWPAGGRVGGRDLEDLARLHCIHDRGQPSRSQCMRELPSSRRRPPEISDAGSWAAWRGGATLADTRATPRRGGSRHATSSSGCAGGRRPLRPR